MSFRLLNLQTQQFLTVREIVAELGEDNPVEFPDASAVELDAGAAARFPDEDAAEQILEDYDYAALGRGLEPPEVLVVEVDRREHIVRYIENP